MRSDCSSDPPRIRTEQPGLCSRSSSVASAASPKLPATARGPDDQVPRRLEVRALDD